ncbi:MAG TPA: queuosine precursor transporter [Steroidobacteraceae bacterium]|nr:queuosine precursor transporter [Gammaproteobacteria bacterium]HEV2285375.1 queuosine precursor transporter [Steroidobacteraceae bacterium]
MKTYRYYDLILGAYVCVLLCANLIGAAKVSVVNLPWLGPRTYMAGVLFFPISYLFGDILTEVYGYARDRRVVWSGFGALAFAALMSAVIVHLPPADFWVGRQEAVEQMFGNTPRIIGASIIAFWCGSFVNSYVLAKMKIWTNGRWLWTRLIGSTVCGELVDTALFYSIAFAGLWKMSDLVTVATDQYVLKSLWEVIATPVTYRIVAFLKRAEHEDYYDRDTDFTPFSLRA